MQAEKVELETTVVDEMQSQGQDGNNGLHHHGIVSISHFNLAAPFNGFGCRVVQCLCHKRFKSYLL